MDPVYFQGGYQGQGAQNPMDRLTPEGMQALMGMNELESQDSDLQQQIAQAQAMRSGPGGPQRYGAAAGALQGLADIVRAWKGKSQEESLRQERKDLMGEMTKQRKIIGQNYRPGAMPQQAPAQDPMALDAGGLPAYLRSME